jgi:hypothetical protein
MRIASVADVKAKLSAFLDGKSLDHDAFRAAADSSRPSRGRRSTQRKK